MEVSLESFKKRFTYDPQKDLLGKGGYSEVYKAYDTEDKIFVALKIYQGDLDSKYNLSNEIRKFKRLRHPNVIEHLETYDVTTGNNDFHGNPIKYQIGILEYANAGTLADLIKQGQLTGLANAAKLESIAKDIISGLEYLHSQNIIHRDLKPSNILLFKEGEKLVPKICDFGIAKVMDNATAVSTQLVGTVEYMAPEYFRTDLGDIGKASDLWSLGVILLEAASGQHPFGKASEGYSNGQIINNILSKELQIELLFQQSTRFVIDYILTALRIKDVEQNIEEVSESAIIINKKEEEEKEVAKKAKALFEAEKEAAIERAKSDLLIASIENEEQIRKKRQRLILLITITTFLVIIIIFSITKYNQRITKVEDKEEMPVTKKAQALNEVTIGKQIWMTKNLSVSTFRNGDPITQVQTKEEWYNLDFNKQPAYCYYDNDPANGVKYGKLYNWYAVNDPRGLAPVGYHIPSKAEWTILKDNLGGDHAGYKMKSTSGWIETGLNGSNCNGSNESDFSGLPSGHRTDIGNFGGIGLECLWWSTFEVDTKSAGTCQLNANYDGVGMGWDYKGRGLSVRCLRD